jgi:hypothetical protein
MSTATVNVVVFPVFPVVTLKIGRTAKALD